MLLLFTPWSPHARRGDPQPCQAPAPSSSQLSNLPFKNSSFSGLCQSDPFSCDLANPFHHAVHGFNRTFVNTASSMGCCYYVVCSQTSKIPKSAWNVSWKQRATQQRHSFRRNHVTKP